ncbi:phosphate/phosphite/phosphonate ABC transporter substrate-binding protein [Caldalkalibacillus salinus]|uniref:phosphate/phosphite/phosphonate ABC transporter substrate-binding protein n=1 Tax=Caldalkalibacillus salinus TaxID=2803787 RepID=UPI001921A32B|nr:phosphate/phosphite/phosphonate ABC transporter substrate-binding protein [Caldalkalibacillus salinus]
MKKWVLSLILMLVLSLSACGTAEEEPQANESEDTFKIGVIPALTEGNLEEPMEKLEQVLDDALEQDVELEVYPDYNGVVEALNFDHIQLAYLGPATYLEAHHRSGAQAILTQLIDGKPYYHSYIVTQHDAPWESLDDLLAEAEEVSFAFGDQSSTSGSIVPSHELKQRGVWEDEQTSDFGEMRYTGSHDATGIAVQNGQVDAGAIDSAYFNLLIEQGTLDESKFKVLWQSEELFQYPWAVSSEVDEETIQTIQDTFINIEDEEILGGFGASAFVEASDEDYESIRKVMEEMGRLD